MSKGRCHVCGSFRLGVGQTNEGGLPTIILILVCVTVYAQDNQDLEVSQ